MITQPTFYIPPEIEAGLLEGTLKLFGGIVRESNNGRIYKHLRPVILPDPDPEAAKAIVARLASGSKKQYAVLIIGTGTLLVGGMYGFKYLKKLAATRALEAKNLPQCVTDFEASLRAYVDAGRTGVLNAEIVDQLIQDLDAVKAFSDEGNEVKISLDELVPLFELVIAHTPKLAEAYGVDLDDLSEHEADVEGGVVVSLRRHLEAQKTILTEVA